MYGGKLQGPVHVFYYRSLYARENLHELQRKRKATISFVPRVLYYPWLNAWEASFERLPYNYPPRVTCAYNAVFLT